MGRAALVALALSSVGLAGCQADQAIQVPRGQVPTARETIPDEQGYKRFRAEAGVCGVMWPCGVGGGAV